jgi:hypothetical protein
MSRLRWGIGLLVLTGASVTALAAAATSSGGDPLAARHPAATPPRPHALQVFINGKRQKTSRLVGGADNYVPIAARTLHVVARWRTNARGTGYHVRISTSEPRVRTYALCFRGTSCRVAKAVPIGAEDEMSWEVRVVRTRGKLVVAGVKVCLVGSS